jgi:hypothetical protein
MTIETARQWVAENVPDTDEALRSSLEAFRKHGWTAGDLDFLLYEAQSGDPGEGDGAFYRALDVLSRLREAGIPIVEARPGGR